MKKVVNGKIYDTKKSFFIGYCTNGCETKRDGRYIEHKLFKTKRSGQYFIYTFWGGLTEYAEYFGCGSTCEGEHIRLVSKEEVISWLEEYDEWFSESEKDDILEELNLEEA